MTDLVSNETSMEDRTAEKRPARSLLHFGQHQSLRVLGFVVVFASVLMSSLSFLILSGFTNIEPSTEVWTIIWIVTGILVLLVFALVVTEAVLLIQARIKRQPGQGCRCAWWPCSPSSLPFPRPWWPSLPPLP
ncbi:hypothetical protein [Devosia aurantiaca]|uniref:Uncharacterized protein n=1 Tax=Devosia aurantiaca TaxID=2714858 RepID=A0A6M1SQ61_9HYPH|nr:hypothetical protein [Devosia aurantiaca]NGP17622.1 hypothetical protein [Devosia aurantiaca]